VHHIPAIIKEKISNLKGGGDVISRYNRIIAWRITIAAKTTRVTERARRDLFILEEE